MICGGGVEVTGGLSMLAADFRLPMIPKPLKREFREFIRERKGQKRSRGEGGGGRKRRQEGEKGGERDGWDAKEAASELSE